MFTTDRSCRLLPIFPFGSTVKSGFTTEHVHQTAAGTAQNVFKSSIFITVNLRCTRDNVPRFQRPTTDSTVLLSDVH